jgi:hypothetical protein
MSTVWILLAILFLSSVVVSFKKRRDERLHRIRATWAKPIDHTRPMAALAESHASRIDVTGGAASVDQRTWTDLNLDDVFVAIDRTTSTLGQHALYHRLRTASPADQLEIFESLTEGFRSDTRMRERAQVALDRLQDPQGYDVWWMGKPGAVEGRQWYVVFPVLTAAALVSIALAPLWPGALLMMLVINLPMRYVTDRRIGAIASSIRQCAPVIGAAGSLRFMAGDGVEPLASVLREDVPRLTRLKWISSWANGNPFMVSFDSSQLSIMFSDLASVLYEYFNLFLLLDATGVYFGVRDLRAHRVSLLRVIAVIGDIDAAISVASYREGRDDWTRPQFRSEGTVTLTDLRHPLIDDAVPNSIVLRAGGGALVTGSNMSGKSTFLRTVGVNAILAQALNTCLAREYTGPRFVVRSCIGRSDDLLAGKSYYIVEVEALLGLVRLSESDRPHLFLLDELFRGTNAIERIAAGQGVLQELVEGEHSATPHVVVAATHDGELVGLLGSAYDAYHFGDSLSPGGLVFDHRLNPGPGTTRTAIALLAQHGAPQRLLSRAKATAAMLDRQRNL